MNEVSITLRNKHRRKQQQEQQQFKLDTPITFTLGNVGFKLLPSAGLFKSCISIFIEPIVISPETGSWETLTERKEFLVPLEMEDPLLVYAKRIFDHIQWGSGSVKVFWKNEGIEMSLVNRNNNNKDFVLVTKKFIWDGSSHIEGTNARQVSMVAGSTFYNPLKNGLHRENYEERISAFETEGNSYNQVVQKMYRKDILNKILAKVGLQLKE